MSINSVQQAPGFNQQQYDQLIEQAKTQKMDAGQVDKLLLDAIKSGKSFDQAAALVGSELPELSPPNAKALALLKDWTGIPTPGAMIMSLITKYAAEQREQNREVSWAQTEAVVASMKDQANEIRKTAAIQLGLGLTGNVVAIGAGIAQIGGSFAALNLASGAPGDQVAAKLGTYNNIVSGIGGIISGVGKTAESGSQFVGGLNQAVQKEMEADQEKMRALRDSVRELNEALRDLIQKSLAAQNDINANTNQTRTKILA
ncbi:MAG: type III secretion system translocon subunit SctB [Deltaproteobacteria bacterium]|jgi:cellobiose-specific phosphotransferase system component IIA|nr:type III secretion system translocon subunit SctB [Deltaproteobacteria bacterium]